MKQSIQINIRVSKDLAEEIGEVADLLKISRSDWIRLTLAREAMEEHCKLLEEAKELQDMLDSDVARVLKKIRSRRLK